MSVQRSSSRSMKLLLYSLSLILVVGGLSCKEPLPARRDPGDVFDTINRAQYVISQTDNSLKLYAYIMNTFDETLEANLLLQGTVTVEWTEDKTFQKTFKLSPAAIDRARHYNAGTNVLTIDSGDTVRVAYSWNFIADDGSSLFSKLIFHKDPSCKQRMVSDSLAFFVRSQVKMFEKTSTSVAPTIVYRFQLHQAFFADQFCTPL
jgi:hypothetical protein